MARLMVYVVKCLHFSVLDESLMSRTHTFEHQVDDCFGGLTLFEDEIHSSVFPSAAFNSCTERQRPTGLINDGAELSENWASVTLSV